MNLRKFFFIILSFFTLASCDIVKNFLENNRFFSSQKIEDIQILSSMESGLRSSSDYKSYLALEYLQFAKQLSKLGDKKSSDYFAKKALNLLKKDMIIPENPIFWKNHQVAIEEMVSMQKRMEIILKVNNLKFYIPIQLAHLTYLYDCWVSRQPQDIFIDSEMSQCRIRFSKLIDEIENYVIDLKKDKQTKVEIIDTSFERFEILFDSLNYNLNDAANNDLSRVIEYLLTLNSNYKIIIIGNPDSAENKLNPPVKNSILAYNRAQTVYNYLTENGVPSSYIDIQIASGENIPDVILSKDNKQTNRSVAIYVLRGKKESLNIPLPFIENQIYKEEINRAKEIRGYNINQNDE